MRIFWLFVYSLVLVVTMVAVIYVLLINNRSKFVPIDADLNSVVKPTNIPLEKSQKPQEPQETIYTNREGVVLSDVVITDLGGTTLYENLAHSFSV